MLKEHSVGYILLVVYAISLLMRVSCHFIVMNQISSINQSISWSCHVSAVFLYPKVRLMYL
jgi:ABC-type uncharacterized transport system permease subunit